ncbi:MAG TPA: PAS domain S-box protein [Thermoanaerobaculaceae bacterium]|nr:PAS domain S-box protein [Thermoanaerobaculaceae bacterium]
MTEHELGLDAFLDALPCAALVFTASWRLQALNSAAAALLAASGADLAGRPLRDFLPDCSGEQLSRSDGIWQPQRIQPARGESRPCLIRAARAHPQAPFLVLVLCEEGKQELCRHVVEDYYHRLWDQAAVGLANLDPETGHIQQCNHLLAQMLGYPESALVGRRFTQLLHGDDQAANEALLAGLATRHRDRYETECLAYRQDGTLVCIHLVVASVRDVSRTPICSMVVAHDVTAQRREEKRLQATEGRFRLLFEQNVAGMIRTAVDGRILECNEAFARMLGYGYPAQVLEHHAEDLFPAVESRAAFIAELQELVRLRNHEVELKHRDGSTLWCLVNATLAPDSEGELTIIEGSAVDITDRRRAEEQLRIQRDLAHVLATVTNLEHAAQVCVDAAIRASGMEAGGFYVHDPDSGCLNLAAWQGISDDFVRSVAVIAPGDPRHGTVLAGKCVFAHLCDLPGAEEMLGVDASLRAVAVVPIVHQGTVIGCFNLASRTRDEVPAADREAIEVVAALIGNAILRIRAESTVRQREAELTTLFDSLRDLVLVVDTGGSILAANRGACANLGFTPAELVGRHVRELHPARSVKELEELFESLVKGRAAAYDLPLVAKDGTVVPVETTVARGTWGGRAVLFGVSRDISGLLVDQQRIVELTRREAVGRLAAGVAHEFNNLLQAMLGHATLLRLRAGDRVSSGRLASDLELQIRRGALLARKLLEFSLPGQTGREPIELGAALRHCLDTLRQLVPEHIAFEVELTSEPLVTEFDSSQLELVIWNLVVNAVEAMPSGGELAVGSGRLSSGEVWFSVADSGLGIRPEVRQHIFEPLFTTKQASESGGMGLAVVAEIVARHHGNILLDEQVEPGARFLVTLPAASGPVPAPVTHQGTPVLAREHRVLLVEDDEQVRGTITRLLQVLDCEVTAIGSGEDAVALIDRRFELLITDLLLPGISGDQVAARLQDSNPDMRVIIVSGYGLTPELRHRAAERGWRILPKPFGLDSLAREMALAWRIPAS